MARPKKTHLPGITFTGSIAKPIDDIEIITPFRRDLALDSPEYQKLFDERWTKLHRLRVQKIPELARQLGLQVDKFDLTTERGLMVFYGQTLMNLAIKARIPGFLEVEPKWNRSLVMWTLVKCIQAKQRGERNAYLNTCLTIVRGWDPDLARIGRKAAAIRRAKTLHNEVTKLTKRLKREHAEKQAEKQAAERSNIIRFSKSHRIKPVIL
jgi:hypothetical protein